MHLPNPGIQDIASEVEKIDKSDQRLDGELHATQDKYASEMEGLALDRMRAKTRLNKQISAACEILKKEFNDDKVCVHHLSVFGFVRGMDEQSCAREMQEKRHNKGGDKVIAIVDSLEAEHQNRSRSDVRTVSTVSLERSRARISLRVCVCCGR